MCIWLIAENHTNEAMMAAFKAELNNYGEYKNRIFKTITADNGSEFTKLNELKEENIGVYFTHPYSSFEKGTNECHNRMLRRFIPKGRSMTGYTQEDISHFADIINGLPRKILGDCTPEEMFEGELDRIYSENRIA